MPLTSTLARRTASIIAHQRQRAREHGQALDYSLDELRVLVLEALELPCPYCRRPLDVRRLQIDHATPVSRGGSFARWNLQVLCDICNQVKGGLTHEEYSRLWQVLLELPSAARMDVISRLRAGGKWRR